MDIFGTSHCKFSFVILLMLKFETKISNERKKKQIRRKVKVELVSLFEKNFCILEKTQLMNNVQSDPCFACCNKYLYFYIVHMNNFQFVK